VPFVQITPSLNSELHRGVGGGSNTPLYYPHRGGRKYPPSSTDYMSAQLTMRQHAACVWLGLMKGSMELMELMSRLMYCTQIMTDDVYDQLLANADFIKISLQCLMLKNM